MEDEERTFYFRVTADPRNNQLFQAGDLVLVDPTQSNIVADSMVLIEGPNKQLVIRKLIGKLPRNLDKKFVGRVVELYIRP